MLVNNALLYIKAAAALTKTAAEGAKAFKNPELAAKLGQISQIAGMAGMVGGAAGDIAKAFKDPNKLDTPSWLDKEALTKSPLIGSGLKIGDLGEEGLTFSNKALQIAPNLETALEGLGKNTAFERVGDVLAGGWNPSDKDYPVFKTRY